MSIPISPPWRDIQRLNFTDWQKLADFVQLTMDQRKFIHHNPKFILNFPRRLAEKVEKGNLEDPILKQLLPTIAEKEKFPFFEDDPVQDRSFRCTSNLLHKYDGRVLLVCTSACVMHCRYCFRQNFEYAQDVDLFTKEIEIIANDSTIHEVILSGGDPLSLSNRVLEAVLTKISKIKHIKRIRFHTRFPIGIPERIDDGFVAILKNISQQIFFIIHVNHPNELDVDIFDALAILRSIGVIILNQSVLLKGINDDAMVLKKLCELLVDNGIIPYYLHQLDRVQGAAHFEVSEEMGLRLIEEISALLPGYAVPKYVREIAGEKNKTIIINFN